MCLHMQKTFPLTYHKEGLSGPFVIEKIYEMTKGNAIMVTEVGQHQMWAAQYYKYSKPRTLLTSEVLVPWDTVSVLQSVPRQLIPTGL